MQSHPQAAQRRSSRAAPSRSKGAPLAASSFIISIVLDVKDSNVVYAISNYHGLYKSTDGGLRWRSINRGFPLDHNGNLGIYPKFLTLDPLDHNTIYTGGSVDFGVLNRPVLFISQDAGASWRLLETKGLPKVFFPITDLTFSTSDPDRLYLSSYGGVYSMTRTLGNR